MFEHDRVPDWIEDVSKRFKPLGSFSDIAIAVACSIMYWPLLYNEYLKAFKSLGFKIEKEEKMSPVAFDIMWVLTREDLDKPVEFKFTGSFFDLISECPDDQIITSDPILVDSMKTYDKIYDIVYSRVNKLRNIIKIENSGNDVKEIVGEFAGMYDGIDIDEEPVQDEPTEEVEDEPVRFSWDDRPD